MKPFGQGEQESLYFWISKSRTLPSSLAKHMTTLIIKVGPCYVSTEVGTQVYMVVSVGCTEEGNWNHIHLETAPTSGKKRETSFMTISRTHVITQCVHLTSTQLKMLWFASFLHLQIPKACSHCCGISHARATLAKCLWLRRHAPDWSKGSAASLKLLLHPDPLMQNTGRNSTQQSS